VCNAGDHYSRPKMSVIDFYRILDLFELRKNSSLLRRFFIMEALAYLSSLRIVEHAVLPTALVLL
jgi:hypothetical protein